MKLVAATGNPKKLLEIQRILEHLGVEVVTPGSLGVVADALEDGDSFRANAAIKAWDIFRKTGLPSIADDSGLSVDALEGRPGIHSARYGGEDSGYDEKIALLLSELESVPTEGRTARFTSAICCVLDDNATIELEAHCEGTIGYEASGSRGFGYDPIFYVGDVSFADFTDREKDEISHRGKALRAFAKELEAYLSTK